MTFLSDSLSLFRIVSPESEHFVVLLWVIDYRVTMKDSIDLLAGALGVNSQLPLGPRHEWSWHLGMDDSTYESFEIYGQVRAGRWSSTLELVAWEFRITR